jgi:hypothetical protein
LALSSSSDVIQQVSRLAKDRLVILCHGGQGQLDAFFADFLRDAGQAFLDQFCGVAARRGVRDALGDDLIRACIETARR